MLKTELALFNMENPEEDAERNFFQGDKRFIGIYSYALYYPGIEDINYDIAIWHQTD